MECLEERKQPGDQKLVIAGVLAGVLLLLLEVGVVETPFNTVISVGGAAAGIAGKIKSLFV